MLSGTPQGLSKIIMKVKIEILKDIVTKTFDMIIFLAEKFIINMPESKTCNFDSAPIFTVPLKTHNSPEKYECYMSCAVRGNPSPYVTWYRNNISLNTNTNYYISNTCGVCSLLILTVGPKDNGEYKVVAENSSGRTECSTQLTIRGMPYYTIRSIIIGSLGKHEEKGYAPLINSVEKTIIFS